MRLAAFVLIGSAVLAQDTDTALEQIRAAEANLRNAQFTMESRVFERSPSGDLVPSEQFSDVEGLIVPGPRARYHVKLHARLPAVMKREGKIEMSTVQRSQEISFDGTTQTVVEYGLEGFDSPKQTRVNQPSSWQGERGHLPLISNRLTHVLPLYEGMGLSGYLSTIPDEAPDWKVLQSDEADQLTIWFPHARFTPDGLQDQMSYVATLDLARGGNIVDWKWYLGYKDGGGQLMGALEDVQLEQVEGTWLPVAFVQRKYSYDPPSGENVVREETRTKLTWSHINAELDPDAFQVAQLQRSDVTHSRFDSFSNLQTTAGETDTDAEAQIDPAWKLPPIEVDVTDEDPTVELPGLQVELLAVVQNEPMVTAVDGRRVDPDTWGDWAGRIVDGYWEDISSGRVRELDGRSYIAVLFRLRSQTPALCEHAIVESTIEAPHVRHAESSRCTHRSGAKEMDCYHLERFYYDNSVGLPSHANYSGKVSFGLPLSLSADIPVDADGTELQMDEWKFSATVKRLPDANPEPDLPPGRRPEVVLSFLAGGSLDNFRVVAVAKDGVLIEPITFPNLMNLQYKHRKQFTWKFGWPDPISKQDIQCFRLVGHSIQPIIWKNVPLITQD